MQLNSFMTDIIASELEDAVGRELFHKGNR